MTMHPCDDCAAIRGYFMAEPWLRPRFNPACLHCGARAIQLLQRKLNLTPEAKRDRCRQSLETWLRYGHDETELRALAKKEQWAVAPPAPREKKQ